MQILFPDFTFPNKVDYLLLQNIIHLKLVSNRGIDLYSSECTYL